MHLHYGTAQILVAIIFLLIALVLAVAFVAVAAHSGPEVPFGRVQEIGYWIRKRWLAFLVALCVVVVGVSWATLPYATGSGANRTTVNVTAGQFYWALNPSRVPVGTAVRFRITSRDVNHGFGLYDPQGHLVGEAQAMPGYTNTLDMTFTRVGQYMVLCLEYCGVGHHLMQGTFTVLPTGHP
jgi:cytochrome c oxidase subunit 2